MNCRINSKANLLFTLLLIIAVLSSAPFEDLFEKKVFIRINASM